MADSTSLTTGDILPGTPDSAQPSDTPAWAAAAQGAASDAKAPAGLDPKVSSLNSPASTAWKPDDDGFYRANMNGKQVTFGKTAPTVADVHQADLITSNPPPADEGSPEAIGHTFMNSLKRDYSSILRWGSDVAGGLNRATGGDENKADALEAAGQKQDEDSQIRNASTAKPWSQDDGLGQYLNTAADKVGGMVPALAGFAVGGPAGAIALNAAQSGGEAAAASKDDPGATALGTAEGGAVAAVPVPFMKPGGAVLKALSKTDAPILARIAGFANKDGYVPGILRSSLGGSVTGTAGAAGNDVVNNYIDGKPLLQVDPNDLLRGAAEGAGFGAGFGATAGALHRGEPEPNRDIKVDTTDTSSPTPTEGGAMTPQQRADSAVQDRYAAATDKAYPSATEAGGLNDGVHTGVAQDIHDVFQTVKDATSPATAQSIEDTLERAGVNATMRTGQNKLKGDVTEDQISKMLDLKTNSNPDDPDETLGQTKQGALLADLLRQSNTVSQLSRGNQLGGLAAYTSKIDPLSSILPGSNRSIGEGLGDATAKLAIGSLLPHVGIPALAGSTGIDLAARGIGKVGQLTGLFPGNSKLGNFMRANAGQTPPVNFDGLRDIQGDYMARQRMAGIQAQAEADNAAFDQRAQAARSAALKAQAAQDAQGVQQTKNYFKYGAGQNLPTPETAESAQPQPQPEPQANPNALKNYFKYGAGQEAGNFPAEPEAPPAEPQPEDRTGEFKNWAKYGGGTTLPQPEDRTQSFKNWAKMGYWQLPQREAAQGATAIQQARTAMRQAKIAANDPGDVKSFDGQVYARTGLKPQEALTAVKGMADRGEIPTAVHDAWRDAPEQLMNGNIGNQIIDKLSQQKGNIVADHEASAPKIMNPYAYAAQAKGNQARVTNADKHILARKDLSDSTKGVIRNGIEAIGTTNNKMSAAAIRDHVLGQLNGKDHDVASSVISPLVEQITHDTPADHVAAVVKAPETPVAIKEHADKLAKGDTSSIPDDVASAVSRFEKKGLQQLRMTKSDAHEYGLKMADAWVKSGKGNLDAWLQ